LFLEETEEGFRGKKGGLKMEESIPRLLEEEDILFRITGGGSIK